MNCNTDFATFVIPFYGENCNQTRIFLDKTLESIFNQTDDNWKIVIVDDGSPCKDIKNYLKSVKESNPEKISVIFKEINEGAGSARNIGIQWAYDNESPFILFNDADDLSHEERLETVRRIFRDDPYAGVVYSTFKVIDEHDSQVSKENLTQSILEIIEGHENDPVQGYNAWIQIGTRKGYTNGTSGTAVKTGIAYMFPFPNTRVSEDSHTWMRYSAAGAKFVYAPEIPFLYRVPLSGDGSSSRSREGGKHIFYQKKAEVDEHGFKEAIGIAIEKSFIKPGLVNDLLIEFYLKLAETLSRENECELAREQIKKALHVSWVKTREFFSSQLPA